MIVSAPSLRARPATTAAFSSYMPGRTVAGGRNVTMTLFDSSSRSNVRLSGGTAGHPGGDVITTCALAGPRARFVTLIVKWRSPPSTGHTTRSGAVSRSKGRVTNSGRRTSPVRWSR